MFILPCNAVRRAAATLHADLPDADPPAKLSPLSPSVQAVGFGRLRFG